MVNWFKKKEIEEVYTTPVEQEIENPVMCFRIVIEPRTGNLRTMNWVVEYNNNTERTYEFFKKQLKTKFIENKEHWVMRSTDVFMIRVERKMFRLSYHPEVEDNRPKEEKDGK